MVIGSEYHWKNPADGFGTGFTDWTPASTMTWGSFNLAFSFSGPGMTGDLSAQTLIEPVSGANLTNTEVITVKVKNEGLQPITGINMSYSVNDNTSVSENKPTMTLGANQFGTFTFNTVADLSAPGAYEIKTYTNNLTDPNHLNDTITSIIYNYGTVYQMPSTGTQTITTCAATFTDAGGLNGNIGMNDDAVTTIYPLNATDRIRLAFLEFNASYGGFEIYNGVDMSAPLIGSYMGTNSPGVVDALNESGALTIHFMGPGWEETPGWIAFISCITPLTDDFELLSLTGSLFTVFEGNTMTLTASVRNLGTTILSKDVQFTVNGTSVGVVNTGAMAPFAVSDVSIEWTAPSSGNYQFEACLPNDGNTINNCRTMERNVLAYNAFFEDFENEPFPPSNWYHGGLWARSSSSPASGLYNAVSSFSNTQSDTLVTCRVDLGQNPVLTFYSKTSLWWKGNLDLYYYNESNATWNFVVNVPLSLMTYGYSEIDLSAFEGTTGRIGFFVNVTDPYSWSGQVNIDLITGFNITIHSDNFDLQAKDLNGGEFYTLSEPSMFTMTIKNNGQLPIEAGDYTVSLFSAPNNELYSVPGNAINPNEVQQYSLMYTMQELTTLEVFGRITYSNDQYLTNNQSASLFINGVADSSEIVIVGDSLANFYYEAPIIFGFNNSLTETIYSGSEINQSGVIFGLHYSFNFDNDETEIPVKIWMGTTELPDLTNWIPANEMTLVFDGLVDFNHEAGDVYLPLQTPYNYSDTAQNLVIMVQRIDDHSSVNKNFYSYPTMFTSTLAVGSNSEIPDPYAPPLGGSANLNPSIRLIFNDNLGSASGIVSNTTEEPLEGVTVLVEPLNITTITDASGNYSIPYIPAGTYPTSAGKFGYEVVTQNLSIIVNENTQLDFILPALGTATITGTIVGNDDPQIGIANALLTLDGYENYTTISGTDGAFSFTNVYFADNYQLKIITADYEVYTEDIDVSASFNLDTITLTEDLAIARLVSATIVNEAITLNWLEPSTMAEGIFSTDDGINENGFAGEPGEEVWLGNEMSFNDPVTVTSFDLFWAKYGNSQQSTHRLGIFDYTGSLLYVSPEFTSAQNEWVNVDIPNLHLKGIFYVMALWDSIPFQAHYLGMDTLSAYTPDNAQYHYEGGGFYKLSGLTNYSGSFLIHANIYSRDTKSYSREITGYQVTTGLLSDIDSSANWPMISPMLDVTTFTDESWPPQLSNNYIYGVRSFFTTGESELSFSNILTYDPVNVNKLTKTNIKVWPNPATDVIYVETSAGSEVKLFTMEGVLVKQIVSDGNIIKFDLNDLKRGSYTLSCIQTNSIASQKVIVM